MHRLHEPLGNRHAETDSATGPVVTELLKWCHDPLSKVLGNARTAIDDAHVHLLADDSDGDASP